MIVAPGDGCRVCATHGEVTRPVRELPKCLLENGARLLIPGCLELSMMRTMAARRSTRTVLILEREPAFARSDDVEWPEVGHEQRMARKSKTVSD